MRRLVLVLALSPCGCLAEYVLPGDATTVDMPSTGGDPGGDPGGDGEPSGGDTSLGTLGDTSGGMSGSGDTDGADACDPDRLRCADACVDPDSDEAHCGGCEESCVEGERCIVGECRDVVVLECDSCPCADQCPQKDQGVLEATSGEESAGGASDSASGDTAESVGDESGGKDPQQHLCCVVEASSQVWCVIGDMEDPLVCP